ncbi:hypothetical protein NO135_24805, partial [Clostridioides difficile]|nr:hypothetical protein [Clostridioides difficile]
MPNHALARATYANLDRAGAPRWNGDAIRIAQELQRNLGIDAMAAPFLPVTEHLIDPEDCEVALRQQMP